MSFEDLNKEPIEENTSAVAESTLLRKLDELLPALMSLSTRVGILEGQVAFLLSKDEQYVAALDRYEASIKEEQNG